MAASQQKVRAAKLKLVAIIAVIILTPALALFLLDDWGDLQYQRWGLLFPYLLLTLCPAVTCGSVLYRLAVLPASPARQMIDRLVAVLCVIGWGLTLLTVIHPHDAARAGGFLTYVILFVALGLCGLFWPLDEPSPRARGKLIPRWVQRIVELTLVVSPLPLAIWLTRIDWFQFAKGTTEYYLPQFVQLALLFSMHAGVRWNDRIPSRASRQARTAPAPEILDDDSEEPTTDAAGGRGVLLSRSSANRRLYVMDHDLWLFPNGILRVPLGWVKSLACVGQLYDTRHLTVRTFDPGAFARATTDPRNQWIPRESIIGATLRHRFASDELRLTLADGRSLRLLWLASPSAYTRMRATLEKWLDERLVVR